MLLLLFAWSRQERFGMPNPHWYASTGDRVLITTLSTRASQSLRVKHAWNSFPLPRKGAWHSLFGYPFLFYNEPTLVIMLFCTIVYETNLRILEIQIISTEIFHFCDWEPLNEKVSLEIPLGSDIRRWDFLNTRHYVPPLDRLAFDYLFPSRKNIFDSRSSRRLGWSKRNQPRFFIRENVLPRLVSNRRKVGSFSTERSSRFYVTILKEQLEIMTFKAVNRWFRSFLSGRFIVCDKNEKEIVVSF